MKTTTPTLNPFAVSYVPLAKRGMGDIEKECKMTTPGKADAYAAVEDLKLKGYQLADDAYNEIPQEIDSLSLMDEDSEIDLAYLQMVFPGVSDQSLVDVYNVNMGDLEAALDMLTDLESAFDQPDALNIDNTVEPVSSSGECSSATSSEVTGATS